VKLVAVIFFAIGIIFTSIQGGRGAPLPPPEELLSTSTVPLENLSLAPGDFIILADLTPVPIESAHVSMNIPCRQVTAESNNNNNTTTRTKTNQVPSSDIKVIAGIAPNLQPTTPEYVAELSRPENNKCTYHVQLPELADQQITDIAIINTSNQTVKFNSGNFATISISTGGPLT
jgi:hypothetical protein